MFGIVNKMFMLMLMNKRLVNKMLVNKMLMLVLMNTWMPSSPLREDFMMQPCQSAQVHGSDRSAMIQNQNQNLQ